MEKRFEMRDDQGFSAQSSGFILKECPLLSQEIKLIILSLLAGSTDPIARTFRHTWGELQTQKPTQDIRYVHLDVYGKINEVQYSLREIKTRSRNSSLEIELGFFRDQQMLFSFLLQSSSRIQDK